MHTATSTPTPNPTPIPETPQYYALIYLEKEPYPEIEIELFVDKVPATVNNFIKLVEEGFYDGLTFHKVVASELVQTGDPTGTGDSGPGYAIENEFHPNLRHDFEGVVAMAVSDEPLARSHGSQFYITLAPMPDRDGLNPDGSPKDCEKQGVSCHTVFGKVIRGMSLVNAFGEDAHRNAIRKGDKIQKIEIVTQYHPQSLAASQPFDCKNGIVVPTHSTTPAIVSYCELLLQIKNTLAGDAKLNWSDQIGIWLWHGIKIFDSNNFFIDIDLHRRGLTGTIPVELSKLGGLSTLDLSYNNLTGVIPTELANIRSLKSLRLASNDLEGCIPEQLRTFVSDPTSMSFCNDLSSYYHPKTTFEGGIDLSVRYIERLPRYPRYQVSYFTDEGACDYPFDSSIGPYLCPEPRGAKRQLNPGDAIELIAHVRNFGDTAASKFNYTWMMDGEIIEQGSYENLGPGENHQFAIKTVWPDDSRNSLVTFNVDPDNQILELIEDNNVVNDWIKGHTIGIYFSPIAYESLTLSDWYESGIHSPEHWFHNNVERLNDMLAEADVDDRIRTELFLISENRELNSQHPLSSLLDGWWNIWHEFNEFTPEGYQHRPAIDDGLIHELMHQIGVIDIYQMHLYTDEIELPDANRPDQPAGCGPRYWHADEICHRFSEVISDLMSDRIMKIGTYTAGALRANAGHRRGYYGEYLFDTPKTTTLRIVDQWRNTLSNVKLRFFQKDKEWQGTHWSQVVDRHEEFILTTDESGRVTLPNRGITGIVTATGHQLRPNPFGIINVIGNNGIFIIEMTSDQCTNYEWLTLVELNLAYWDGQTEHSEFTKTLRCPPP